MDTGSSCCHSLMGPTYSEPDFIARHGLMQTAFFKFVLFVYILLMYGGFLY